MTPEAVAWLRKCVLKRQETAKAASGGTVVGEAGNWQPAPGGDEWEVYADLKETGHGKDGDLELLVALRPGLPRPPDVMGGYWGSVIAWHRDYADRNAWVPEPALRHAALNDPADTLARCEAELGICDYWQIWNDRPGPVLDAYADAVRAVAGAYQNWDGWDEHFGGASE